MKTPSEHEDLLDDLVRDAASSDFRELTLAAGLRALRWKRRTRSVIRLSAGAAAIVALGAAAWIHIHRSPAESPVAQAPVIAGTHVRILTDQELFAFFKGRPVALYGDGAQQHFVLLDEAHPASEAR